MNNIEKLANECGIEFGKYHGNCVFTHDKVSVESLVKFAKALQSSEPVAFYSPAMTPRLHWIYRQPKEYTELYSIPPASVPLEKYNKLLRLVVEAKYNLGLKNEVPLHIIFAKVEKIVSKAITEAEGKEG